MKYYKTEEILNGWIIYDHEHDVRVYSKSLKDAHGIVSLMAANDSMPHREFKDKMREVLKK